MRFTISNPPTTSFSHVFVGATDAAAGGLLESGLLCGDAAWLGGELDGCALTFLFW